MPRQSEERPRFLCILRRGGAAALRHGLEFPTNLRGLHEMRARGHQLALVARESIDGRVVAFKGSETDLLTRQVVQTTEILELRTNPTLTDQAFARP